MLVLLNDGGQAKFCGSVSVAGPGMPSAEVAAKSTTLSITPQYVYKYFCVRINYKLKFSSPGFSTDAVPTSHTSSLHIVCQTGVMAER